MSNEPISPDIWARAERLIADGWVRKQVAKELGISKTRLYERFPANHEKIPQETLDRAKMFLDDGASYSEVARTTGISRFSVTSYFPGRGWKPEQTAEYAQARRAERNMKWR